MSMSKQWQLRKQKTYWLKSVTEKEGQVVFGGSNFHVVWVCTEQFLIMCICIFFVCSISSDRFHLLLALGLDSTDSSVGGLATLHITHTHTCTHTPLSYILEGAARHRREGPDAGKGWCRSAITDPLFLRAVSAAAHSRVSKHGFCIAYSWHKSTTYWAFIGIQRGRYLLHSRTSCPHVWLCFFLNEYVVCMVELCVQSAQKLWNRKECSHWSSVAAVISLSER